ncbi:MAG: Fic family protein [Deltaproteobacteria bacterium]|nr:Fic family protein [Deltaproteobacteria bacterium]
MLTPRFTITNRITAGLTQIERARGFLEAAKLSEDWLEKMRSRALLLEAHHTTHIEGTRLTLEQAEAILDGRQVAEADPGDVRELLNYRTAFEFVSEYLGREGPITEGLIREIHKRMVQGVRGGTAAPGKYRAVQNYVVNSLTRQIIYTPPAPGDVPVLMSELVAWLNGVREVHPVLVSGIAQFQLVHIHPFVDGNGRTSRLLSTLCLYRAGYDFKRLFTISEYYDRDRSAFYAAIQNVREQGMDLTVWLDYFVDGLATQMIEVTERGKWVIRRDAIAQKHGLSARQALAVGYLLENPVLRIEDYEQLCRGINRRTLQRDIKGLVERGVLKAEGSARAARYKLQIKGL